jgi:hypothetical protein
MKVLDQFCFAAAIFVFVPSIRLKGKGNKHDETE